MGDFPTQSGSTRVLVADADEGVRTELWRALHEREIGCDCVSDGAAALSRLRDGNYGLVVLDLDLSKVGSAIVLDHLRSLEAERPIVLATLRRGAISEVSTDLVQMIIRKPIRISEIADMIRDCLEAPTRWQRRGGGASRGADDLRRV